MVIYFVYIIYSWIGSLLFGNGNSGNRRKLLTILLWFGLFAIMALRAEDVGNDLVRYLDHFQSIKYINVFETRTESGYIIFLKILDYLGIGRRGYIVIVSFIVSSSFSWFFYKYSKNITLSFLLHLLVGLFAFSFSGIRQTLAICITLFAFNFIVKKKLVPFILLCVLAFSFHSSALIFLLVYLFTRISINSYKKIMLFTLLIIVMAFFNEYVISFMGRYATEKYTDLYLQDANASKLNLLPVIFQVSLIFSIVVIWIMQKKRLNALPKVVLIFFSLSILSVVFTVLAVQLSTIGRLAFYFIPYINVLIPNALRGFHSKDLEKIMQILIYVVCIAYFSIVQTDSVLMIDNYSFGKDLFRNIE